MKLFILTAALWMSMVAACQAGTDVDADLSGASSNPASDTFFNEIELTPEGITATDTLGGRWTYNFERDQFVPEIGSPHAKRRGSTRTASEVKALPVRQRCTEELTVKRFQTRVDVGYGQYVTGNIIAYGKVTINGWVKGDVQSITGRVLVTGAGQVDGTIKSPEIEVKPGGVVQGDKIITDPLIDFPTDAFAKSYSIDGLIIVLSFTAGLLLLGFLAVSLARKQFDTFRNCMIQYKIRTFFLGLGLFFLLPFIIGVVAITIVGLVAVPFIPMCYVLAAFLGVIAQATGIAERIGGRLGFPALGPMTNSLAGTLAFMIIWFVVAILLGAGDSVSRGFGAFFLVVAILASAAPVCAGIGAAALTRFGFREYVSSRFQRSFRRPEVPTPPPPRTPQPPSVSTPLSASPRPSPGDQEPPLPHSSH